MTTISDPERNFRLEATKAFAHTMIVVDDQASQSSNAEELERVGKATRPSRGAARAAAESEEEVKEDIRHFLDAKQLIDNAMDLGLVCSVLRPGKDEELSQRVAGASRHADIVVVDWEIYDDGGETAKSIISEIVRQDDEIHGRLRLIAVYTGERNRQGILNDILSLFSDDKRAQRAIRKHGDAAIVSNDGLRIVYLFKTHGTELPEELADFQVSEGDLPGRLQIEFSLLSEGLLSNVALATIASVRSAAHHIVGKFSGRMDGPYFHHRTNLRSPDDAEEYSVNVVLSELKNAIDKNGVASTYAGQVALAHRIEELANGSDHMTIECMEGDEARKFNVQVSAVQKAVADGWNAGYQDFKCENPPSKKTMLEAFSTLFDDGITQAKSNVLEFACLTGLRAYPGSHQYKNGLLVPVLGLGSVVQDGEQKYWVCLQASCDAVRLEEDTTFLFAPFEIDDDRPTDVVPMVKADGSVAYVGLRLASKAYTKTKSFEFTPDPQSRAVIAVKIRGRDGLYFKGKRRATLRWIADLKQRRAIRTSRNLGMDMERLGFDEFEPFRNNSSRVR